jgi:hypothetical protein
MTVVSLHVAGKMKLQLNKLLVDWLLGEGGAANRNKRDGLIVVREVCEA